MKRTLLAFFCLLGLTNAKGQSIDTAAMVVDRYISLLNMKELPRDSMVVVTSIQVDRDNPSDTTIMRRWDAFPNKSRSEVWYKGRMLDGFVSNGADIYMFFDTTRSVWRNCLPVQYLDNHIAFDIRGPLYYWRTNGSELRYLGKKTFQGNPVDAVEVRVPSCNVREYFFEQQSGLLFLYRVMDEIVGDSVREEYRTDWRAYHEFQPKGRCFFPSVESYQNQGHVYIIHHHVELLPIDDRIFYQETFTHNN